MHSSNVSVDMIHKNKSYTHSKKGKSMLLSFPLIFNYSVRSLYSHTKSYNNAVMQCHADA